MYLRLTTRSRVVLVATSAETAAFSRSVLLKLPLIGVFFLPAHNEIKES